MLSRFHSRGRTRSAGSVIAFNFNCPCAIVDFLVLEIFNSNNLLTEAVVCLKLFYPKSLRKQVCAFLKAPNFIL